MSSRYYTPNIDEFHVGFEYELKIPLLKGLNTDNWHRHTCRGSLDYIQLEIENEAIRVKYLDVEDIKSLGFDRDGRGDLTNGRVYISLHTSSSWVEITKESGDMLFDGSLKNKSELKRVLNQIGYEAV